MGINMPIILILAVLISFIVSTFENIKLVKNLIFFEYISIFKKILLITILLIFLFTSYYIGNKLIYYITFIISYIAICLPFLGSGICENGILYSKDRSITLAYQPFSNIDKVVVKKRDNHTLINFYGSFKHVKFEYSQNQTKDIIDFLKSKNIKVVGC